MRHTCTNVTKNRIPKHLHAHKFINVTITLEDTRIEKSFVFHRKSKCTDEAITKPYTMVILFEAATTPSTLDCRYFGGRMWRFAVQLWDENKQTFEIMKFSKNHTFRRSSTAPWHRDEPEWWLAPFDSTERTFLRWGGALARVRLLLQTVSLLAFFFWKHCPS